MQDLLDLLKQKTEKLQLGGGLSKIEKHKEKGKLTAWERITYLLDDNQPYVEIGKFAADGMYAEHGGCPNAGVVVVLGYVSGRLCVVVSNDATVKAGAWFPMTGKKIFVLKKSLWKTIFLLSTWSIPLAYTYPCKMKFSRTKNTLVAFLEIMPNYLRWAFHRYPPSWVLA